MQTTVSREAEQSRYAITHEGDVVGVAEYREDDGRVTFTHTTIDPDVQEQGLGTRLAAEALDDVRERGLRVVPECRFIASFIDDHPEYQDLLADR